MSISIFEIMGPIMIGPSSSHTAGAARLARIARILAGKSFRHVSFGLHGSFARTYQGHGTDKALVAGALGFQEDDERLPASFSFAEEQMITFTFYEEDLTDYHENTVKITFELIDGESFYIIGSSIGGGQIFISDVNGFDTCISASAPTLVIFQNDLKGVISDISSILANSGVNIGVMKVNRKKRGKLASCVIEVDDSITEDLVARLRSVDNVVGVRAINL